MANTCPTCMANMDMVGVSHRCIPKRAAAATEPTVKKQKGAVSVPAGQVTGALTITQSESLASSYKYRDPDKRRAYMREYMKRWRVT